MSLEKKKRRKGKNLIIATWTFLQNMTSFPAESWGTLNWREKMLGNIFVNYQLNRFTEYNFIILVLFTAHLFQKKGN